MVEQSHLPVKRTLWKPASSAPCSIAGTIDIDTRSSSTCAVLIPVNAFDVFHA
jgi:hypothetical protein